MLTSPVSQELQSVLSDSYSLFLATHNYHWNVEGPMFASLHEMFEQQYTELFKAIDEIAERIRALGDYTLPFTEAKILNALDSLEHPVPKEGGANVTAKQMVANLISLQAKVIESCQSAKEAAVKAGDDETEDLMIERITTHQKASWMLKSMIKE